MSPAYSRNVQSAPQIAASGQDQEMIATAQRFGGMLDLDLPQTLTKPISVKTIATLVDDFCQEADSAQQQKTL